MRIFLNGVHQVPFGQASRNGKIGSMGMVAGRFLPVNAGELVIFHDLPIVLDCRIDFFDVIDVAQDQPGPVGGGRTDDDGAATENLLDQRLGIADTSDFIQAERLVEAVQNAAFTADASGRNDIKLIFTQQDNVENPNGDHQRDREQSQRNDSHIHLAVVPDHSGDAAGKQGSESDAQNDSDGKPDGIPYTSDDKEKAIPFDPVQDFFILCFVHGNLLCFVLRPPAGTKHETRILFNAKLPCRPML